jgi:Xaa-Pro aminopeptidase
MPNKNSKILNLLRNKIKEHELDGFLIPSTDEFQNEYLPESLNRLKFITGFTGSNGVAIITLNHAYFFTDGRYLLQAEQELGENFKIENIAVLDKFSFAGKIGYDPKLHTKSSIDQFTKLNLVICKNLVDLIWKNKTPIKVSKIFEYRVKYSGASSLAKQELVTDQMRNNKIDALIFTDSTSICWLLNIRAHDVEYNPILLSYLIIHNNGQLELFSSTNFIANNVKNYSFDELSARLKEIVNKKVQLDPNSASIWISSHFNSPIFAEDPCLLLKACKNRIEITCARKTHIADGVAICKLLYWLEQNSPNQSEVTVADKLLEFRKLHNNFIYPSFPTIAGFKEHGAIIHYKANENSNKKLNSDGLFLLDSGGQYFGGTTDITRTISIGKASKEQKHNFTLVLKGHIALANAKFPFGTSGAALDILARQYLWQEEKDYAHGTGHGVGNCLSVHEGPQRISKMGACILKPGMILSNEPGFYKNHEYGIRIESLMLVIENKNNFLSMETLTLAPIEINLILSKMLSDDEKSWLNSYHQKVFNKISPFLDKNEKSWLKRKTKIIN